MKRVWLSDGYSVYCDDPNAARILFTQVKDYFKYGINVQEGDVVFDIGANIGIFSSWIHHQLKGKVDLYAFEPIPDVFNILRENSRYFSRKGRPIKIFNYAILDRNARVSFNYYHNAPAFSSVSPYSDTDRKMFINVVKDNLNTGPLEARFLELLPSCIRNYLIEQGINKSLEPTLIQCNSKTLSTVIKSESISRIDLLKIDVEKAEMQVIDGIRDQDWGIIQKVAIEVHDYSGRLIKLKSILKSKNFSEIFVEQEDMLKGSNIYSIFARK